MPAPTAPFTQFFDLDGSPLDGGFVYLGQPDLNPELSPIPVYWDVDGQIPAAQPIRTLNGYTVRNGRPATLYVASAYSLVVFNRKRMLIMNERNLSSPATEAALGGAGGSALVAFQQSGVGAAKRTLQDLARDSINLKDFFQVPHADYTQAWQNAVTEGIASQRALQVTAGTYRITAPATGTGKLVVLGSGPASIIQCDDAVLDIGSGTGSQIDNLYLENITAPWIITRDPSNWLAPLVIRQSNDDGYQPTVNDEIWSSLTASQQNQDIGPKIVFRGNATGINITRIYGRFVSILLFDAQQSVVSECNFRAGKNFAGGILFWNIDGQEGRFNEALHNVISFASFNGICMARQYDGKIKGNTVTRVGESGIKTYQNEVAGVDARCYRMQVSGNDSTYAAFDSYDLSADYPHTGLVDTRHEITDNSAFGGRRSGYFGDGKNNTFTNNRSRGHGLSGYEMLFNSSMVALNWGYDNNKSNASSGHHEMTLGGSENAVVGNTLIHFMPQGGALYAPGTNKVGVNTIVGGMYLGNAGAVTARALNNDDGASQTFATVPQAVRQNAAEVPALTLYSESGAVDNIDILSHPRRHVLPNPITRVRSQLTYGAGGAENGVMHFAVAQAGVLRDALSFQTDNNIPGQAWPVLSAPPVAQIPFWLKPGSVTFSINKTTKRLIIVARDEDGGPLIGEVQLVTPT